VGAITGLRRQAAVQYRALYMARTFYDVLLVNPRADRELISVVYRHLAKRYHPDVDPSPEAATRMAELNEAYAILGDHAKRARYDQQIGLAAVEPPVLRGDGRPARRGGASNTVAAPEGPYGEAGPPPPNPPPAGHPLTFGRYRGWTLNQVGRYDHDYLEWLSRTTMGRNYKRELDLLLRRRP
jgi:curved DNA-binding protein CbpA